MRIDPLTGLIHVTESCPPIGPLTPRHEVERLLRTEIAEMDANSVIFKNGTLFGIEARSNCHFLRQELRHTVFYLNAKAEAVTSELQFHFGRDFIERSEDFSWGSIFFDWLEDYQVSRIGHVFNIGNEK